MNAVIKRDLLENSLIVLICVSLVNSSLQLLLISSVDLKFALCYVEILYKYLLVN